MIRWIKRRFRELCDTISRIFSRKARLRRITWKNRSVISRKLGATKIGGELRSQIIASPQKFYRRYYIPKKSGGNREICEPSPELKKMQGALLQVIKKPDVSAYCAAYEKGKSVKLNAAKHQKAKHILHIDIKNFFPSIDKSMFFKTYKPYICFNCRGDNCTICIDRVWNIVSLENGLPIGARTSPFIANRVMTKTDKILAKLDKRMTYTRYADDMIFSSKSYIDKDFVNSIEKVINTAGFEINHKKTFFMTSRKQVTGVIINKGKLSVGTAYKKKLKNDIYNYLTKGIGKTEVIKGRLAHLANIEPQYANTIRKKYAALDDKELFGKKRMTAV